MFDPLSFLFLPWCPTVPTMPSFFTKVLNKTAMQVFWELPSKPGKVQGFKLSHRMVPEEEFKAQELFPSHINTHTISHLGQFSQEKHFVFFFCFFVHVQ